MRYRYWEPIPQELLLHDVVDETLIALSEHDALVLNIVQIVIESGAGRMGVVTRPPHSVIVRYWRPSATWAQADLVYQVPTTIREMLQGRLNAHSVMVVPRVETIVRHGNRRVSQVFLLLGSALMLYLTVIGTPAIPMLFLAFVTAVATWLPLRTRSEPQLIIAGHQPLNLREAVDYGRARLAGERPELVRRGDRELSAEQRVAAIRDEYGKAKLDIVTRIEQPALFDEAAPTTATFLEALITYDDATTLETRERAAADVEMTYSVALDHAAAVGINHLPKDARDAGRRAAKAARLAEGAATHGERQASLFQVKRILDSLALYYMPRLDERLQIEAPDPS